jgi:hypothetical protein
VLGHDCDESIGPELRTSHATALVNSGAVWRFGPRGLSPTTIRMSRERPLRAVFPEIPTVSKPIEVIIAGFEIAPAARASYAIIGKEIPAFRTPPPGDRPSRAASW